MKKWQPILKQFTLHLLGWLLLYAFLYSLRSKDGTTEKTIYYIFTLSFTSALSSYFHFRWFRLFFEERKYKKHLFYGLITLLAVTFLNQTLVFLFDKSPFLSSLVSMVFVFIFSTAFYFAKNGMTKQIQVQELKAQQLEAEMKLLKVQINPHFLFNTLNNLYGLVLQSQNEQAAEIILKLSALMRYLLESSKLEKVSLRQEVQFIQDYLVLEKIRLAQQADIRFEVSGLEANISITPLLFVPLVENAFKHGLQSLSEDSFAHFSLAVQGKEIFFEAQNSIGKNLDLPPKSEIGLTNLRRRLELMYPAHHFLEIEKKDGIFKVILQIKA